MQGSRRPRGTAQPIGHTPTKEAKLNSPALIFLTRVSIPIGSHEEKRATCLTLFPMSHCSCGGHTIGGHQSGLFFEGCVTQYDASQATGWECALQIALNGPLNGGATGAVSNDPSLRNIQPRSSCPRSCIGLFSWSSNWVLAQSLS
jgi:hypothetical protein